MQGGPSVGHPTHKCFLRLFFFLKDCVYLDAERLYDHIKRETFQTRSLTSPPRQARVKQVRKLKDTVLIARALQIQTQRCRHAL